MRRYCTDFFGIYSFGAESSFLFTDLRPFINKPETKNKFQRFYRPVKRQLDFKPVRFLSGAVGKMVRFKMEPSISSFKLIWFRSAPTIKQLCHITPAKYARLNRIVYNQVSMKSNVPVTLTKLSKSFKVLKKKLRNINLKRLNGICKATKILKSNINKSFKTTKRRLFLSDIVMGRPRTFMYFAKLEKRQSKQLKVTSKISKPFKMSAFHSSTNATKFWSSV